MTDYDAPEEWRPVPHYPRHEASNQGRIRTIDHMRWHNRAHRPVLYKGHVLAQHMSNKGHLYVTVHGKHKWVHVLVGLAWIGPKPFPDAKILHWDDDPLNNWTDNLRWGTQSENMQDRIRNSS
jgi:hypothetical protein